MKVHRGGDLSPLPNSSSLSGVSLSTCRSPMEGLSGYSDCSLLIWNDSKDLATAAILCCVNLTGSQLTGPE